MSDDYIVRTVQTAVRGELEGGVAPLEKEPPAGQGVRGVPPVISFKFFPRQSSWSSVGSFQRAAMRMNGRETAFDMNTRTSGHRTKTDRSVVMPHARPHDFARPLALDNVGVDHAHHWVLVASVCLAQNCRFKCGVHGSTNAQRPVPDPHMWLTSPRGAAWGGRTKHFQAKRHRFR